MSISVFFYQCTKLLIYARSFVFLLLKRSGRNAYNFLAKIHAQQYLDVYISNRFKFFITMADSDNIPRYILYTRISCFTSTNLLQRIANSKGGHIIHIQDADAITHRPKWLDGTPILADTELGIVYKGTNAKTVLERILSREKKMNTKNTHEHRKLDGEIEEDTGQEFKRNTTREDLANFMMSRNLS